MIWSFAPPDRPSRYVTVAATVRIARHAPVLDEFGYTVGDRLVVVGFIYVPHLALTMAIVEAEHRYNEVPLHLLEPEP